MKVLWFSVTPSLYEKKGNGHNGGGWISALEEQLTNVPEINLAVAFIHKNEVFKVEKQKVTYYPISLYKTRLQKLKRKYIFKTEEVVELEACRNIIEDYKPDIIHVFGSEWSFGLIAKYIEIPVVIHIQGLANPYLNAFFPPGYNKIDYFLQHGINIKKIERKVLDYLYFKYRAERETRILKGNQYFMGRTKWDKAVLQLLAPNAKYFYCSESLRSTFLANVSNWIPKDATKRILITTISGPLYKGADLLLKTARLLKEETSIDFEWRVFGVSEINLAERKVKTKAASVNMKALGVISAENLKEELLNADIFIHPSYIDNSPNSICEAQVLGLPILSTYVGGIPSLIRNEETGILVPANDPYSMAAEIINLLSNPQRAVALGAAAKQEALKRHDPTTITKDLINIYKKIIFEKCNG